MQIVEMEIQARERAKGAMAAAGTTPPARRSVRSIIRQPHSW